MKIVPPHFPPSKVRQGLSYAQLSALQELFSLLASLFQVYELDPTEKRFLDFSISNEGGQKSLNVRRLWDIRETLDFSVHLHCKWKNLGISSLLGLVHKLEIRLPEAKTVLKGRWFLQ